MKTIKRILVPTDFSSGAEAGYAVAQKLAIKFEAEIDLIHVVPSLQHFMRFMAADMNLDFTEKMLENARTKLESAMTNFDDEIRGEYFIKIDRKPAESILEHSEKRNYDLIIMGARGGNETKMRRGGVTRNTIRTSRVPVLTVDSGMLSRGVNNILVPTDGSELSFTALVSAVPMAAAFGADITLLYVAEMRTGLTDTANFIPDEIRKDRVYNSLIQRLGKYLELRKEEGLSLAEQPKLFEDLLRLKTDKGDRDFTLHTEIVTGFTPHYEIETYASENSDLVVMATHGHTGFAHVFMGSVTEKVVQYLKKPVMTVRPAESDFKRNVRDRAGVSLAEPLP
jgi:nucleotide-binding universal stress UspA family protein